MGASYSRNHSHEYTSPELDALNYYNDHVAAYLWIAIGSILLLATCANLYEGYLRFARRRAIARIIASRGANDSEAEYGLIASVAQLSSRRRWASFPSVLPAIWAKYTMRKPYVVKLLCIDSIGQLICVVGYVAINFGLVFGPSLGGIDWSAHHAANLCFANIPLIIGLASKNNVISMVTGIPYEKLNCLHRWSGRLIVILSFIHIGGRLWVNVPNTSPDGPMGFMVRWGWAGWALFILAISAASRRIRNLNYTFFKYSHIVFIIFALISMIIHRPEKYGWILAGFIIWSLDRIARLARVIWHFGINPVDCPETVPRAWVEALSEDTVRVTVRTTQCWLPGQHAYLHIPSIAFGGHPFSIASNSRPIFQTNDAHPQIADQQFIIRVRTGLTQSLYSMVMGKRDETELCPRTRAINAANNARHTRPPALGSEVLHHDVEASVRPWRAIAAWTEGSYGRQLRLGEQYETLLLFCAGSGLSYGLPIVRDLVRRARAMQLGKAQTAIVTQRLVFVWVIKDASHLDWIQEDLYEAIRMAPRGFLHVHLYVTGKASIAPERKWTPGHGEQSAKRFIANQACSKTLSPSDSSRHQSLVSNLLDGLLVQRTTKHRSTDDIEKTQRIAVEQELQLSIKSVSSDAHPDLPLFFRSGRPNISQILEDEIQASALHHWVAVGVCGTAGMTRDVADACSHAINIGRIMRGESRRKVYFEAEEFGW